MARLRRRMLEEMVFERLLGAIDPDAILGLGQELDRSLERAVDPHDARPRDPCKLKLALVRGALDRLDELICDLAMQQVPFA